LVKDSEENALKSMLQNFVCENLNSEDDDFKGNMVSQTCLFDEILLAENSQMPLGDKTANLNVEPELEETSENKYCELKQEIRKLKNVLNHEILQSRELENGLAEDVFKLKESINHELLLPREYIHHVNNRECQIKRTRNQSNVYNVGIEHEVKNGRGRKEELNRGS
jgi:hypothetical protein